MPGGKRLPPGRELMSSHDDDGNDDDTLKTKLMFTLFTIIPTSLICIMWPNYAGAVFVGKAFKFR